MDLFFVPAKRSVKIVLLLLVTVAFLLGSQAPAPAVAAPAPAPEQGIVQAPPYVPIASVSLAVPTNAVLGENFTFTATFANTSSTASDAGYGPFIDIILPANGADGNGNQTPPLDGINFISATYLGNSVTSTVLTFPGSGAANTCVDHPYAVAPVTGDPLQVCGAPGDVLVVLQLPFGSFVPGQPPATVEITASLSNLADVGIPLNIRARGGYQYGATPLNDWCCAPVDATILSHPNTNSATWPGSPVTPRLFTVTKAYNGTEDETATGPNFVRQYTVTVDIANGQTLTNLDVSDILPNNMQFVAFVSSTPASSAINTPSTNTPGGTLTRRFASATGTTSTADATMTFSFYIPRLNSSGGNIIHPVTGAATTSVNEAQAVANWTPIDPRDTATPVTGICGTPCHTLTDRSIATQKSVTIVSDAAPTGYSSGDVLEYSLNFQVSDFFAFEDVTLTDILSDGQQLDLTSAPTLAVNGNGYTFAAAPIGGANYDEIRHWTGGPAIPPVNGTTELVFRVSDELVTRGHPGRLIGGCIDPGSGSNPPNCGIYDNDATTGTIIFRAVIQQNFTDDFPSGDASVDHGDVLDNALTVSGDILDPTTPAFTPTGSSVTDGSATDVTIAFGALAKGVYAINGTVCDPCTSEINNGINPGDTVTFRLTYTQPASNFEETTITDYLPLPIFVATEVTAFSNAICGVPGAGNACLGPADTFHILTTPVPPAPTLSTNGTANTVAFNYADYDNTSDIFSEIDLLFSVTVTNDPFADGLFLTNQAHVAEGTTNATPTTQDAIIQLRLSEPALYTTKAAVSTDNPNGVFTPPIGAPILFNAPGTAGLSWSGGTISSTYLDANPINSNLRFVDAGDLVRFAIVVYNEGSSAKGAFDISIRDTLQPGYVIPGGLGLNLQIYRGDGLALTYTDLGGGIFGSGIRIDDPGAPGVGACQSHDATNGRNIIILTYDLQLDNAITLDQDIINTATLFNYAGTSGGPDFTNPLDLSDTAIVQPVTSPVKSITATSETHTSEAGIGTTASPRLAAVGEIIRFRIVQGIPEGVVTNLRLHDALPNGLIFLDDGTARTIFVSTGGAVTSTTLGAGPAVNATGNETTVGGITPTFVLPDTAVSAADSTSTADYGTNDNDTYVSGTDIYFKFGTVNNPDRDPDQEFVVLEFNAIIANIAGNTVGVNRDNTVTSRYGSSMTDGANSPVVRVRVVEPSITFGKTIVSLPSPLDAGGAVQYRLSFANATGANDSDAFDIHLTDALPAQLQLDLVSINVTLAGGAAGVTDASALNNLDITIGSVPAGGSVIVDYTATIRDTVTAAEIITNTSTSTWTSLPGPNGTSPNGTGSTTGTAGSTTGERIGTMPIVAPNNYTRTSSQNFTIASPSAFTKQLTDTSASHTSGANVAIGEEVTYDILLTFPEGTTPSDTVVDDLPTGLEVVAGTPQIITTVAASGGLLTADFNGTIGTQNIAEVPGDGGSVTFEFTNVTTPGDNLSNNTLLMRFRARVTDIAANIAGATLSNSATNRVGTGAPVISNAVTISVVEPSVTFGKTIVSLPTPLDAGGVVHYRITYVNGTGVNVSTAMDVNITDALAAALRLPSTGTPDIVITTTAGIGAVTNNSTTSNIDILVASVPPGESVTVDFYPVIQSSITPGQVIDNVGNSTWTSLSGPDVYERTGANGPTGSPDNYAAVTSVQSFTIPSSQTITKQLTATSASHTTGSDVTIGEEIMYDILLTFPEGATPSDTVVDDLPTGLEVISGTPQVITTVGASGGLLTADFNGTIGTQNIIEVPGDGGSVTFEFANVSLPGDNNVANNTVLLRFRALVLNDVGNQNAGTLSNTATNQVGAGAPTTSNVVNATVVEPVLHLTKQVSDASPAVGQMLTFTLLLSHDAASTADAFDVLLADDLPAELTLDLASINITTGGAVTNLQTNHSANHVEVTADSVALGATIQITYQATVSAPYAASFHNDVVAIWTSLPGTVSGERDGSGTPAHNDYRSTAQTTINVLRDLVKNLVASNVTSTSPDHIVTIGEILTYQVVLTIPAGATDLAVITDTLDNGLAFVDCATAAPAGAGNMHDIIVGPDITSSNFTFAPDGHGHNVASCNHGTTALNSPQISNSGGTIRLDLGNITNTGAAPETITLTYRVIMLDVGANVQNVTLDNDVDWTWMGSTLSTRAVPSLRIVEPDLGIEKTVDPEVAAFGSTVTYSIEISHTTDSLTTAYDVLMTDGIPTGLTLDQTSVTVTGSASLPAAIITTSPTQFSVYWSEFPLGATATVTFEAEFVGPSPVYNTANVEWSSLQIDPAPHFQAQSAYNPFSTERRYDPLDQTVNDYAVSATAGLRQLPGLPRTGFAPGKVTVLPKQPADFAYSALGDLWLEIPRLNLKVDIVGVPFTSEKNWNLTWLGGQAGYLDGTVYPTHAGNSGITAHAYLADGLPGPFVDLIKLRYGDQIIVHLGGQRYIYEVRENKLVRPNDLSVLKHEEYPWLTLLTCKSYNEHADEYQFRVSVRAVLMKVENE